MEDTTQRLQEAIAAARSNRLAEARSIAEELTESDPKNAHAWFLRGILSEDEAQQRAYLSRTLELDPEHKAARKRMEQLLPVAEGEEVTAADELAEAVEMAGAEDEAEAEAPMAAVEPEEDATMVADSAAFMAAVGRAEFEETAAEVFAATPAPEAFGEEAEEALAEPASEAIDEMAGETAEAVEDTIDDTMIAQSPFAEEMAAEDLQVEALFGEAVTAADEDESQDEGLATLIGAAAFMEEEEATAGVEAGQEAEQALEETAELKASDLAEAAASATILDETDDAWFEEEAGEDLWAKVEAEAVPDWLIEDTTSGAETKLAEEALDEAFQADEGEITREQELPDWLLEEPDEDWSEPIEADEAYDEAPATVFAPKPVAEEPAEEEAPALFEEEMPAPAQPKKKSSNRGLEFLLVLLIIVALLLVLLIGYFLINPPNF